MEIPAVGIRYEAAARKIRLTRLTLVRGQTYRLRLAPLRDPQGRKREPGREEWEQKAK